MSTDDIARTVDIRGGIAALSVLSAQGLRESHVRAVVNGHDDHTGSVVVGEGLFELGDEVFGRLDAVSMAMHGLRIGLEIRISELHAEDVAELLLFLSLDEAVV